MPEEVANKIAAGEVVEGPFSVVKELIENAIDAQADEIAVDIKGAGSDLIRVADNGVGMNRDDALAAFDRFATSKLTGDTELEAISTLGFRGEALPSIAAVSRVRAVTCERHTDEGTEVVLVGGDVRDVGPGGRAAGTTIEVSSLFFNTPARRKFLKSARVETRRIMDTVSEYAILYPAIRFDVMVDGKLTLSLPAAEGVRERVAAVVGGALAKEMLAFDVREESYRASGFVGKPTIARAHRTHHVISVNGRPIRDRMLTAAIRAGYGELLPRDRFPVAFVLVEADGPLVDVNAHPTKREVRFGREREIFALVEKAVRQAFSGVETAPTLAIPDGRERREERAGPDPAWRAADQLALAGEIRETEGTILTDHEKQPGREPADGPVEMKFWQLHGQYIFVQTREGALLLDQHAAHERIVYESARRRLTGIAEAGPSQQLLFPVAVELSPGEWETFSEIGPLLANLGFSARSLSGRTVLLEAVPGALTRWPHEQILRDILAEVPAEKATVRELTEGIARTFACKAAIKAGDPLSQEEMRSLVDQLFATELPYSCPHGRPTLVRLTLAELNKRFGRT